tara:strand:+ start:223 stop:612 length:390 start_codon:yes stop_codon:yes gene_type:complete
MKNIAAKTFILLGIILFSFSSFGQNNDNNSTSNNVKTIKQAKSESNPTELKTIKENKPQTISIGERRKVLTTQEKIEAIESHIEAIDTKVAHVNADDELKEKATQENWFDKMQTIREELVTELNELKNQ